MGRFRLKLKMAEGPRKECPECGKFTPEGNFRDGKCVFCNYGLNSKPKDNIKVPEGRPITRPTVEVGKSTDFPYELTDAQKAKREQTLGRWNNPPKKEWYNPALHVYFMEMEYSPGGPTMVIGIDPDGTSRS